MTAVADEGESPKPEEFPDLQDAALWRGGANPHNIEAEQALLSGLIISPDQFNLIEGRINPEDFFISSHAIIFTAMLELRKRGRTIDLVLLRNELHETGRLEAVGGAAGLMAATGAFFSGANAEHYADIVRDLSARRRLIQTLHASLSEATTPGGSRLPELLEKVEAGIQAITAGGFHGRIMPLKDAVHLTWDNIDRFQKQFQDDRGTVNGLSTGFIDLDRMLTGLHADELIIIAGRPSMGKSTFAMNLVRNVSVRSKLPAAFFTLEMSAENIARNLLACHARVDGQKLRNFILTKEDQVSLGAASEDLFEAPLWVDETPALSLSELRGKVRMLLSRHKIVLVVIDYLQLMTASSLARGRSREQEVSEISRGLKALAKEIHIPVIALSQLSRRPEGRQDPRPILSDLRESGAIEQDADVVLMLHRPDYYSDKTAEKSGDAEVIVAKQRNGPTGTVTLTFINSKLRFENQITSED
ncbi:MAG: replicative DNA helicase [Planctomycetota bacterium]|jgi:replicative DNA helicase|nr:replicative DNA helicase [Planctomycetota bacterium]